MEPSYQSLLSALEYIATGRPCYAECGEIARRALADKEWDDLVRKEIEEDTI